MTSQAVDFSRCILPTAVTRRVFWATQPDACPDVQNDCGDACGAPGLRLLASAAGTTIDNTNYVRGLILNSLLTDGRRADSVCGSIPGRRGGHWSEAFMGRGVRVGALFRDLPVVGSISDAPGLVQSYAQAALDWMVPASVVLSITATAKYAGRGRIALKVAAIGQTGAALNVGVSGVRLENAWAWST